MNTLAYFSQTSASEKKSYVVLVSVDNVIKLFLSLMRYFKLEQFISLVQYLLVRLGCVQP
jgi:hypothetical protein